jgi:predicted Zn finger-like uncharacterized protein
MYSQCPDCQTRFRVTAAALRAAHGTVRCGRCGSAFDALERLSDSIPPPAQEAPPIPLLVATDAAGGALLGASVEYHFSAEDLERIFVGANDWQRQRSPPAADTDEPRAAAGGGEPTIVEVHEDARVEDITLEGERIGIDVPPEEDEEAARESELLVQRLLEEPPPAPEAPVEAIAGAVEPIVAAEPVVATEAVEATEPTVAVEPAATTAPAPAAPAPAANVTDEPVPLAAQRWHTPLTDSELPPVVAPTARFGLAWTAAGLVLALVLAAQLIHYFRQDLVRHPQVGPPLRAAYDRLGLALLPNWDLGSFELRQWGNDANAAAQGSMVVRASLKNRAAFAQPHPILRLELEDRFGSTVATRDFEPADYLKNPSQGSRLLAPGASSEAELLLADPGSEAVGYRLDVCLRESASLLRCAGGSG